MIVNIIIIKQDKRLIVTNNMNEYTSQQILSIWSTDVEKEKSIAEIMSNEAITYKQASKLCSKRLKSLGVALNKIQDSVVWNVVNND